MKRDGKLMVYVGSPGETSAASGSREIIRFPGIRFATPGLHINLKFNCVGYT